MPMMQMIYQEAFAVRRGRQRALPAAVIDRPAPRKPRPEGRGQGELYKNGNLPHREAPPGRAGRLH
jgi:hypothetical protein